MNLEQVESLERMAQNPVLEYVERTLHVLGLIESAPRRERIDGRNPEVEQSS